MNSFLARHSGRGHATARAPARTPRKGAHDELQAADQHTARTDLDQLKRQAKELLEAYRASIPGVIAEVEAYHRTATRGSFALHDAQFVLARAHGFESWPKLKAVVEGVTAARLHEAVERGDLSARG